MKQSEISRGPVDSTEGPSVSTDEGPDPVVRRSTRGKAEVPATRKKQSRSDACKKTGTCEKETCCARSEKEDRACIRRRV